MSNSIQQIGEWQKVDSDCFHNEILPLNRPAVLKSLVSDWPAVKLGSSSPAAIVEYLKSFDQQTPVYTIVGDPAIGGRFFYRDDLQGINFQRTQAKLSGVLDQLLALVDLPEPHAIAVQAASVRQVLPGFDKANPMALLDESVEPTMWLGNKALVAPHYDVHDNIACVIAGKREFTLFPPDQIANLYVGPTLDAPGGVPISLVDLQNPDLARFPNYSKALKVAQRAVLEPGDAIFIPSPWWHAVQSLEQMNVLVNYWWGGIPKDISDSHLSPSQSLMHSMLTISKLSAEQRRSWRHFFDYFVFQTEHDPTEHLPDDINDLVTTLSPNQRLAVYKFLKDKLG